MILGEISAAAAWWWDNTVGGAEIIADGAVEAGDFAADVTGEVLSVITTGKITGDFENSHQVTQEFLGGAGNGAANSAQGLGNIVTEIGYMGADVANDALYSATTIATGGNYSVEFYEGYLSEAGKALDEGEVATIDYYKDLGATAATFGLNKQGEALINYHYGLITEDEMSQQVGGIGLLQFGASRVMAGARAQHGGYTGVYEVSSGKLFLGRSGQPLLGLKTPYPRNGGHITLAQQHGVLNSGTTGLSLYRHYWTGRWQIGHKSGGLNPRYNAGKGFIRNNDYIPSNLRLQLRTTVQKHCVKFKNAKSANDPVPSN